MPKIKRRENRDMKGKLREIPTILVITMLLLGMIAFPVMAGVPTEPKPDADAMWIEPGYQKFNTSTTDIGDTFQITVWLKITSSQFYIYQVKLLYDSSWLTATAAGFTEPPTSQFCAGHTSVATGPDLSTAGEVFFGETLLGADAINPPRVGSLVWINFTITAAPNKGECLDSDFDITTTYPADTWVWDPAGTLIPTVQYNGLVEYNWAAPPNPNLEVDPTLVTYTHYENAVGKTFNIKIYIDDLSAAWYLTNASFILCYNTTLINFTSVVIDPFWFSDDNSGTWYYDEGPCPPHTGTWDRLHFFVTTMCTPPYPSGRVLVATITFKVKYQDEIPPRPPCSHDDSPLFFCNVTLFDHSIEIPTDPPVEGLVVINALQTLPLPWLEVSPPSVTMGPDPSIGKEFDIDIQVHNLHWAWYMVAFQFRLSYCPTLLEGIDITEGPFLQDPKWNKYGTFFISSWEANGLGPHALVGGILLPNMDTGLYDQFNASDPYGTIPHTLEDDVDTPATVTTITFKVIKQDVTCEPSPYTCALNLSGLSYFFVDQNGEYIPHDLQKNGTYEILASPSVGRIIDLTLGGTDTWDIPYGDPWDPPYGGQGWYMPSDMIWPQKIVYLYTEVTYNCWPVQDKIVSFEIEGPFDQEAWPEEVKLPRYKVWAKLTAVTDKKGIAWIKFQMPWTGCSNPEELFGKWKVTATVDICEVVVIDTLAFDYRYLIEWVDVSVEPLYPCHSNDTTITIKWKSKAQQKRPVLISAVIIDELEVPIGIGYIETTVGGAKPCHYVYYEDEIIIHIPKWAFAGYATIHVNAFDKDPTEGGSAWCPQYHDVVKYPNPWALPGHPWLVGKPWIYILPCPLDP